MKKLIMALTLFAVSAVANAVTVEMELVSFETTSSSGTVSTLITDGSHVQGFLPSNVVWTWDGSTLTGTGLLSATGSISSSPFGPAVINEEYWDLQIFTGGTPGGTHTGSAFVCNEGTFMASVGFNGCGGYDFGFNFADESTTTWGPGLATSQTIGGDDTTGAPVDYGAVSLDYTLCNANPACYGLDGIVGVDGLTVGDLVLIGNAIPLGVPDTGGELMTFRVVPVPAAAWLFGSALGLLGWARRRVA